MKVFNVYDFVVMQISSIKGRIHQKFDVCVLPVIENMEMIARTRQWPNKSTLLTVVYMPLATLSKL